MSNELAVVRAPVVTALEWTAEQRQMIRDTFANGANDEEFAVLMETARVLNLNPFKKQVYFIQRWDSMKGRKVWSVQVAIDGLRAQAERTGLYAGQDEPEYVEGPNGSLVACKVRVYRKDWPRPAVGVAYFAEYVQTNRDGKPTQFWSEKPHIMIAKCAEALALRKAFPEQLAGQYAPEEMGHVEVEGARDAAPVAVIHARQPVATLAAEPQEPVVLQKIRDDLAQLEHVTMAAAAAIFVEHEREIGADHLAEAQRVLLAAAPDEPNRYGKLDRPSVASFKRAIAETRAQRAARAGVAAGPPAVGGPAAAAAPGLVDEILACRSYEALRDLAPRVDAVAAPARPLLVETYVNKWCQGIHAARDAAALDRIGQSLRALGGKLGEEARAGTTEAMARRTRELSPPPPDGPPKGRGAPPANDAADASAEHGDAYEGDDAADDGAQARLLAANQRLKQCESSVHVARHYAAHVGALPAALRSGYREHAIMFLHGRYPKACPSRAAAAAMLDQSVADRDGDGVARQVGRRPAARPIPAAVTMAKTGT